MRDILGLGMFRADSCDADGGGLAGFGKCVVARIEVLTFLSWQNTGQGYLK